VQWFFAPHADIRVDVIRRSATTPSTDTKVDTTTVSGCFTSTCESRMLVALFLRTHCRRESEIPGHRVQRARLDVAPACTLCHRDNLGGLGTVEKPFGLTAMYRGLNGTNGSSVLPGLLDDMEADGVDSDGDGVGDIEELRMRHGSKHCGQHVEPAEVRLPQHDVRHGGPTSLLALTALAVGPPPPRP
jgi:hypothetical protein